MKEPATAILNQSLMKRRHGCLTAYLVFIIIANSAATLIYLLRPEEVRKDIPDAPDWVLPALIIASIINVVCAVALIRWKRWGFWGFVASAILMFFVNLFTELGIASSLAGLLGIAILYGVLHIGKERKGWSQLE